MWPLDGAIQVLPPTSRTRGKCSEDGQESSSTFQEAIRRLGEEEAEGTVYESWAEMPQERARLLGLVQKTLATGRTGAVVFVSGDQHWGELMAKRMPESEQFGASQVNSLNNENVRQRFIMESGVDSTGSDEYSQL